MLTIAIETANIFYRHGLMKIIEQTRKNGQLAPFRIVHSSMDTLSREANIIFTDDVAIINIFHPVNVADAKLAEAMHSVIHMPFKTDRLFIHEIQSLLARVFDAAMFAPDALVKSELSRKMKLRAELQLSEAERRLIMLTALGNNIADIARIMHCSVNNSYTYRRNAIRKLGMDNRLQFYKYTQILKSFSQYNNIFLCL